MKPTAFALAIAVPCTTFALCSWVTLEQGIRHSRFPIPFPPAPGLGTSAGIVVMVSTGAVIFANGIQQSSGRRMRVKSELPASGREALNQPTVEPHDISPSPLPNEQPDFRPDIRKERTPARTVNLQQVSLYGLDVDSVEPLAENPPNSNPPVSEPTSSNPVQKLGQDLEDLWLDDQPENVASNVLPFPGGAKAQDFLDDFKPKHPSRTRTSGVNHL